ncbi:MAG TPA: FAD-binding oxidoreductase [Caulobacteraceae bacterium]|nr:FAD-binding oxidoreductase [Caulobacteraceae bacterium]
MLETVTLGGGRATLGASDVTALRGAMVGAVLAAGDDGYEAARRVWNGNIDRQPALIARCVSVADVQHAVVFAKRHGLLLAVRGGGHSAPGYGVNDGGMVIDLTPMKAIVVDPGRRTARAEGGVLWRELDAATQEHGLAVTGGTVSNTGIAGLTLGGGIGWLSGKYGATVDSLLSAEVVTADGRVVVASAQRHPDLFWALRGGGGNFGVVTTFEYRLYLVGQVLGGLVLHPLAAAADLLKFYREAVATLPDEGEVNAGLLTLPDGTRVAGLVMGYNGDLAAGEAALAPFRAFGAPIADMVRPMSYGERQVLLDEPNATHGLHRYWRSAFTEQMSDEFIRIMIDGANHFSSPMSALLMFYMHGAMTRVGESETAFAARRPQWDIDVIGQWADPAESERHIAWVRELWAQLEPELAGSVYVNHISTDDAPEKVRASFGPNYARLRQVKATYDPDNLFRFNSNIPPA